MERGQRSAGGGVQWTDEASGCGNWSSAVAVAKKNARIVWALLTSHQDDQRATD
jgi:hypothetical protein